MSEYTKQANEFLSKHGITFHATHTGFGAFFEGETESRNIYRLRLSRKGFAAYIAKFGQSVHHTHSNIEPTAYDLLTCITKSDPGTFADFCDEYGYSHDSRAAEKTWRKVVADWRKVQRFFSSDELVELQEIN